MLLTVIVPCFNEAATIEALLRRVVDVSEPDWEIIVVDDGSDDESPMILKDIADELGVRVLTCDENRGKTAAVRDGLAIASGRWILVQDADLEYDPGDIKNLVKAARQSESRGNLRVAIYGKRPSYWHAPSRWMFASGVLLIDSLFLLVYGRFVRDHATCYKLVRRSVLEAFDLQSTGFEGCVEITAKLMRCGIPIEQVPISYVPRRVDAGKKLSPSYGLVAAKAVFRWSRWQPTELSDIPSNSPTTPSTRLAVARPVEVLSESE